MTVLDDPDGNVRAAGRLKVGASEGEFVLTHFGYVYAGKGLETLFEAAARLLGRGKRLRVVILGGLPDPAYVETLKERIRTLAIEGSVVWTGDLPEKDVSTILRGSDACVLPFDAGVRLNNTTVAVAAAHSMPIIATRGEEMESQFRHDENTWLCPPRSPEHLADSINTVMEDQALRSRLAAGSGQLATDVFSWDRNVHATIRVLEAAS